MTILYFTATGNCLYVAKQLGGELLSIPQLMKNGTFISAPVRNDRLYYVLCIIQYLLLKVNPNTTFPARLKALLAEFPNADISAMGFPNNWEKETLWQ